MRDDMLLDANVISYAYDSSEPKKRAVCQKLVEQALQGRISGVVTNQILIELFNALTRKLGIRKDEARIIVKSFIASVYVKKIDYSCNTVDRALINSELFNAPFLDVLIAETMKENGITKIITEDEKDFDRIPSISVINPFK